MTPRLRMGFLLLALGAGALAGILTVNSRTGSTAALRTRGQVHSDKDASYTVNLSPAGEVRFAGIPQRVVTLDANYNDMLLAVGQEQKLVATGYRDNFFDGFYMQLPGVKVLLDPSSLRYLASPGGGTFDKETLYALKADVHHIDPVQLASMRGWSRADVEEIARNVGPFVGNRYSRDNNYSGSEPYTYYTLWELSHKVAEVYQRPGAIERLHGIHKEMLAGIRVKLPPKQARPRVGLVYYNRGQFTTYSLMHDGFGQAHYRDLEANDAFESIERSTYGGGGAAGIGTPLDVEGLLALNPDVLIMPFAVYPGGAQKSFEAVLALRDDPLIQRINAFRNGRVYPGGTPLQGPLFYLFQLEMAAKQIYPEIFGPYRDSQVYPKEEQLFDRERVAEILNSHAK